MIHDEMCTNWRDMADGCPTCDLIRRVREACSKECGYDHN